ncbi:hypothetical protein [Cryobacterium tagatosivorans]|uniref:Uncharacterized protein n=1 Tax=Cryobacterium tagatosivorans TaxID=1259199 RepID=A0A4R8UJK9_9MICO|nr:hypothetical protein [Cryobacterium tagatosivorans]TFB56758.1 hypothetical protein E3O23_00640 [Cryobacterium tagatosivorans]
MIPARHHDRVNHAEAWMQESFGMTNRRYTRKQRQESLEVCLHDALRVMDNAGVDDLIPKWRREEGLGPRGAKQIISERAVIALMLVQMRVDGDLRFNNMANTITMLTNSQRERMGIRKHDITQSNWYDRIWSAVERLQRLVDAYPGPRKKLPTPESYAAILAARDPEACERKRVRLSLLCNRLVEGSVLLMPRELRRRFQGNHALDATKIPLNGKYGGPSSARPDGHHLSASYDGGWWVRNGSHDGSGSTSHDKRCWAIEAEITTMVANTPGEAATFPLLANGVSFHKPGAIKGEGLRLVESLLSRGYIIDHFIADRAYLPNSVAEELQLPLAKLGVKLVFDYKDKERGKMAQYEDLILVGGVWYINIMPKSLINAHALYEQAHEKAGKDKEAIRTAKENLTQRLSERKTFRMKPKGIRRPNGSRQFMYPDPSTYTVANPKTGELLSIDKKTIVVPLATGKGDKAHEAVKFGQEYPHDEEKWAGYYGLRNTVESQNAYIKDSSTEDIEDPKKRRARGNTFASLAVTMALVSANIRKILTFIRAHLSRVEVTSKNRSFENTYYSAEDLPSYDNKSAATPPESPPPED